MCPRSSAAGMPVLTHCWRQRPRAPAAATAAASGGGSNSCRQTLQPQPRRAHPDCPHHQGRSAVQPLAPGKGSRPWGSQARSWPREGELGDHHVAACLLDQLQSAECARGVPLGRLSSPAWAGHQPASRRRAAPVSVDGPPSQGILPSSPACLQGPDHQLPASKAGSCPLTTSSSPQP